MNRFLGDTSAASAFANERQGNRLLRLRFPGNDGPPYVQLLANALDAREYLSRGFKYKVEVLSDDASVALDAMMGKLVVIDLVREDGTLRYFSGYVFEFSLAGTDGGFAVYKMVLRPWLDYLKLGQDCVAFNNMSLRKLTERVFAPYLKRDWKHSIRYGDADMTYVCQHNESHHNLLHRLWEARGWYYRYEHRADGHTLWLADDTVHNALPIYAGRDDMRFHDKGGSAEDDGIHQWQPWRRIATGKSTVSSYNFKDPRSARMSRDSMNKQGAVPQIEVHENSGAYGFRDREDGRLLSKRRMEVLDAQAVLFKAEGNDRSAEPLRTFWLADHFRTPNGANPAKTEYLIVSVRHQARNNYENGRGAESSYSNKFTCIPKEVPWLPPIGHNSKEPRVFGVQTALVVGPPGEEIYTDGYGRIKLQFHWDRLGKNDDFSSPWVRVMTGSAGWRFGQISVPRVGMEVVVQFLDGNLARPLVIGAVYNENNMPPWPLPENKTQSGILTRSTMKGSASTANALRFEDMRGREELWLHAEKDQRIEVEHDESHWVGNDRKKNIDHDETVVVKNDRTETVGHDEKITIHHNRSERVDHNEQIDIGDNRTETVGKNDDVLIGANRRERVVVDKIELIGANKALAVGATYDIKVQGVMSTEVARSQSGSVAHDKFSAVGRAYHISAGDTITIVCGGASWTMQSNGAITIKGSSLNIDIGGPVQINGKDVKIN